MAAIISLVALLLQILALGPGTSTAEGQSQGQGQGQGHSRLSVPRVLLPAVGARGPSPPPAPPSHLLQVSSSSSCYSWSTPRDDVIAVLPLYDDNGCSCAARVSVARSRDADATTNTNSRVTAIVLVQDTHTGEVLRCDVIVDRIRSLELVTTTRELFVEEAPEKFEVRAYDDQGNEFTTLEGIEFSWTVVSLLKDNDVIRLMNFADSTYEGTEEVKKLEADGLRGNIALLEGVRTGSAKINVRLPQAEYVEVDPVEVTLRVIANLLISPPEASILLGDRLSFRVIQVKEGKLAELALPSAQYSFRLENESIASLNSETGSVQGLVLGNTDVLLYDAGESEHTEASHSPKAFLRVVEPYSIIITTNPALPSKPWSVEVGHDCSIRTNIFDRNNKAILIGSETRISIDIKYDHFRIHSKTLNGSIVNGVPYELGVMKITAELISVAGKAVSRKISASADLHIVNKVQIIPSEIILPWHPLMKSKNEFQLTAIGGDGSYQWKNEGTSVIINNRGLLTANHLGESKIFANMLANPHINDTAKVWVIEPLDMEIVWSRNEGAVGEILALHVALYGEKSENSKQIPFNNCDKVNFDVSNIDGTIFENIDKKRESNMTLKGDACTVLFVKCVDIGRGRVMIQQRSLRKTVAITCYNPLQRVYPPTQHKKLLLTVGSSANVIYTGGFIPSIKESNIKKELTSLKSDFLKLEINDAGYEQNYRVYTVSCIDLGETQVFFKLYKISHEKIFLTEASLTVVCAIPHSIKLAIRHLKSLQCPITLTPQVNADMSTAELEITVLDSEAHVFHNASSLALTWADSSAYLTKTLNNDVLLGKLDEQYAPIPVLNYHYQILFLSQSSSRHNDIVEISLEIQKYNIEALRRAGIERTQKFPTYIKDVLPVKFIKPISIDPEQVFVYNHPGSIREIKLLKGSGFFKIDVSNSQYANVDLNNSAIKIQPVEDGIFSITVTDLCLESPPTTINVEIVSIKSISAEIPALIQKGQNTTCQVWAYSKLGSRLPIDDNSAPSLTYHILEGHITIKHVPQKVLNEIANFIVTGLDEGEIRIQFSMGSASDIAASRVFSPLQIIPSESIIMPGSHIRLLTSGGPPPPAIITFYQTHGSTNAAKISKTGDVDGLSQGNINIECRAESDGEVLSKAVGIIRVVNLEGIQIFAPVTTLLTGNTIPLYALGLPDTLGPDILGSVIPNLQFHWYVTGEGAAVISDILVNTNVDLDDSDRVSVRLTALRAGRITVHLVVTGKIGGDINHKASYDISLIEPLKILSPANSLTPLLLALNSTFNLRINYGLDVVNFKINDENKPVSKIIKVSEDGQVTSFNQLGHVIISISTIDSQVGMKQVIFLPVEVCSVRYVMSSIDHKDIGNYLENFSGLPKSLKLEMKLLQYDSLGRAIEGNTLKIGSHSLQPHILNFYHSSSNSVEVTLNDVGKSVLKLSDKSVDNKIKSDYIPIKVQTAVSPQEITATVGDVWCMSTIIGNGTWHALDDRAIFVDPNSGFCQAKVSLPDNTEIQFLHPQIQTVSYTSIVPLEKMWFVEHGQHLIVTDERPFIFNIILGKHDDDKKKTNNLITENGDCLESVNLNFYPFNCHISSANDHKLNDIFISSVFDATTGTYGCKVVWSPVKSEKYYTNETKQQIKLWAQSKAVSTRQLKIDLLHAAIAPQLLKLTDVITPLDVTGPHTVLDQIQIVPVSKSLIVTNYEKISDNLKRFYIKLTNKDIYIKESYLILHSALTKQSSKIKVSWSNLGSGSEECSGSGSPILNLTRDYLFAVLASFVTVFIIAIVYKFFNSTTMHKKNDYIPVMSKVSASPSSIYQSRSPLSISQSSIMSSTGSPSSLSPDNLNTSTVYGDPSYLSSPERRRNRRNNLFL